MWPKLRPIGGYPDVRESPPLVWGERVDIVSPDTMLENLHRVYSPYIITPLLEYLVAPVPLLKWITTYYACVGSITFRENAFRNGQFHETSLDRGVTDPDLALCLSLSHLTLVNSRSLRDARIFNRVPFVTFITCITSFKAT